MERIVTNSFPYDNELFVLCCERGYIHTVTLLLRLDKIDPSAMGYSSLKKAAYNGHFQIVQLLLRDNRIDIFVRTTVFLDASIRGHYQLVELLLNDPLVTEKHLALLGGKNRL